MSNTCFLFAILETALPWLCVLALFRSGRSFPFLWSCVAGIAVYQVFLYLLSLTLGHLGLLGGITYRVGFATACATALLVALYKLPSIFAEVRKIRYKPHWYDIPVFLCCLRALQFVHNQWFNDWSYGTPGYDGMHYHIPRALQWYWHGNFLPYPTPVWTQLGLPYGGAATMLPRVFNGCGWLGGAYTTLVLSIGASAAVALISRSFQVGVRGSLLAGLILLSCPAVGLRMVDVSTDIGATFPVIAAVALVRTSSSLPWGLLVFGVLVGIGGGVKQYSMFTVPFLALALFGPSLLTIVRSPRSLAAGVAGVASALGLLLLSLWPIYAIFGDLLGGAQGHSLSNIGKGWSEVRASLIYNFLQWSFEPLGLLPEESRKSVFAALGFDKVWAYFGFPGPVHLLMPYVDRERMRALSYSIILLPWVVMAVKRGYRIAVAVAILAITCIQVAPLTLNLTGARFTIIVLAAYSVAWAARAAKSPILVGCLVLVTLTVELGYANRGSLLREFKPSYQTIIEVNKELKQAVGEETVFLTSKPLALDAEIAGRLGQVRFEYFGCPANDDWVAHFQALKAQGRWFMVSERMLTFVPGPEFQMLHSHSCRQTMLSVIRDALVAAGWVMDRKVVREYELWTHS